MIYLATVYSAGKKGEYKAGDTGTASKNLKTRRYRKACKKAAELMQQGNVVFSPIAHSHAVEVHGMKEIQTGDFWLSQDLEILKRCDKLVVYKMEGWENSRGIKREIAFAEANNIPIEFLDE